MPAERTGKRGAAVHIDPAKAIRWLLQRERAKVESVLAPDGTTTGAETKRLRAAQADLAELEAAERRGDLMPYDDVKRWASEATVIFTSQLEGLPGRMANTLAGMDDAAQIRQALHDEVRRIRSA